ncbi:MAG: hypothetical protein LBE14_07645 [Treponema sp.]|nr:hypothetical protein [Treponema sp.]
MKDIDKFLRIIAIGVVIVAASTLMACDNNPTSDEGGGCPNRTCFYNSDSNWSFCNQESCALAYDYGARCNCN